MIINVNNRADGLIIDSENITSVITIDTTVVISFTAAEENFKAVPAGTVEIPCFSSQRATDVVTWIESHEECGTSLIDLENIGEKQTILAV